MKKYMVLLFFILIFICVLPICSAKVIYENSGMISFEAPNNWYYNEVGEDSTTYVLLSVSSNEDSYVSLKQSKFTFPYKTFKELSPQDKSTTRDECIRYVIKYFAENGYSKPQVAKSDILDNGFVIVYSIMYQGIQYKLFEARFMKDYICYSLVLISPEYNIKEAINVLQSLSIKGVPFTKWINT